MTPTLRELCAADLWAQETSRTRAEWGSQSAEVQQRYQQLADKAGALATTHIAWVLAKSPQAPGVRLPWTVPQLAALIYRYVKPPGSPSRYRSLPPEIRRRYERAATRILSPQMVNDVNLITRMFEAWVPPGTAPPSES